ncbi:MAG: CRISPR system precrRNA processing endoribonuclease RAMP protein Cas6 [Kouleothrix sp.]|nr:CRISPR system precrRNA processing endoribonuclease RAMP protein Cas6 [Kouleothrix sp.]
MTTRSPSDTTVLAGLDLPILRARVTMRLLEDAALPAYKGGMLRGGFGYAFQRSSCPQACWGDSQHCAVGTLCPYRWIFETPHPPDVTHLHDLQDVPRPFVIEPPLDGRTRYGAGDALEFGLVLIGRGIDQLAYFLFGFEQLGRMGLGRRRAPARLERVEALAPWQPTGQAIYQDGRALAGADMTGGARRGALYDAAQLAARAAELPGDLRLRIRTPLRVKSRGELLRAIDPAALAQAACWRLNALATFHGGGPWPVDHRAIVEQARGVAVEQAQVRWEDWERTSTRGPEPKTMTLGGMIGVAVLRGASPDVRAVLLAASLVHLGKACVFGHGEYRLEPLR